MDIPREGRKAAGAQALNQTYLDTARLLTQVAPLVFADKLFALKGGTAINLFVRDMPRLSVDLDLVFTDHRMPRDEALAKINEAVKAAAQRLKKGGFSGPCSHRRGCRRDEAVRAPRQA
jgi:predicted nucleotidyltransferase component of viral defense system